MRSRSRLGSVSFLLVWKKDGGQLEGWSCHDSKSRDVSFLQQPFCFRKVVTAVIVAAVRDDNHGAMLIDGLLSRRTHSQPDAIK